MISVVYSVIVYTYLRCHQNCKSTPFLTTCYFTKTSVAHLYLYLELPFLLKHFSLKRYGHPVRTDEGRVKAKDSKLKEWIILSLNKSSCSMFKFIYLHNQRSIYTLFFGTYLRNLWFTVSTKPPRYCLLLTGKVFPVTDVGSHPVILLCLSRRSHGTKTSVGTLDLRILFRKVVTYNR